MALATSTPSSSNHPPYSDYQSDGIVALRCKKAKLGSNIILVGLGLHVAQERQAKMENPLAHAKYDGFAG